NTDCKRRTVHLDERFIQLERGSFAIDACGWCDRVHRPRLDDYRDHFRLAARGRTVERSGVAACILHDLRRILSRHAGTGPTTVSLLWPAGDRHRYARLAHGARRSGPELCGLRIAGLSRVAGSDS